MKWINTNDIRNWAKTRNCQETLPLLVRKLIRANSNSIRNILFPSGDNIHFGGWDGILEVTEATEYLPEGLSLWEFGVTKDVKGKADKDYEKRKSDSLGFEPENATFVFVTPHLWDNREEWIKEKKEEGYWKDVIVYNAEYLEEWIEAAPTVGSWLAKHLNKYPNSGIEASEDFWERWVLGKEIKLNSKILLGGRESKQQELFNLYKSPNIITLESASKEESLAFIISCFKDEVKLEEDFFSRSIIVETVEAFRELIVHEKPLILIPRFEDTGSFNLAITKGHTLIVPISLKEKGNSDSTINLPRINRDKFIDSLVISGLLKEKAEYISKNCVRNITVLRRQLEFERTTPVWASQENVEDIIPALIIGKWDESLEIDRQIVERVSGLKYEDYIKKISKWLYNGDTPIIKIGSYWRLVSPLDCWSYASKYLTRKDFELLSETTKQIFSEINPSLELEPEKRYMAAIYGKQRKHSSYIREGILTSLILISIFGDKFKFDLPTKGEYWVDTTIREILATTDDNVWKSLNYELPLLSEASPSAFLNAVQAQINIEKSPIKGLFDETKDLFTSHSYHTGLLWALENLAWLPEHFSRSCSLLAELATIDPGGNLANRPINSLNEIFKPWHYQTLASFDERFEVLKLISRKHSNVGWTLLTRMLPDSRNGTAFFTHKMRYRMLDIITEKNITYAEINNTYSKVVDLLIETFDFTENRLVTLIEESVNLSINDRIKILEFIDNSISKITHSENLAWHCIRKILSHHRSHPDTNWALGEDILKSYQNIYEALNPKNEMEDIKWMFEEHWPSFSEGIVYGKVSNEEGNEYIKQRRIATITNALTKYSIDDIINLNAVIKQNWYFGEILAEIVNEEKDILSIAKYLIGDSNYVYFTKGFFYKKYLILGKDWLFQFYTKLELLDYSIDALVHLLLSALESTEVWDFVELQREEINQQYWKLVQPHFYHMPKDRTEFGIKKLIDNNRFLSAVHISSQRCDTISSQLIIEALEKAATISCDEQVRIDDYNIHKLFETLDKRTDVDNSKIVQLEWHYLSFLDSYNYGRKAEKLHQELLTNPNFFIEVIQWVYQPDENDEIDTQYLSNVGEELNEEQRSNRAERAFKLLYTLKKTNYFNSQSPFDFEKFAKWIVDARKIAIEKNRVRMTDAYIGSIIACTPHNKDGSFPTNEICELLESLNSDVVNRNLSCEIFNQNGSSSRGAFDGGDIERGKARHFSSLADKHRNKYPIVTSIFEGLARGYEQQAIGQDESAERDKLEY